MALVLIHTVELDANYTNKYTSLYIYLFRGNIVSKYTECISEYLSFSPTEVWEILLLY
jgi:hypothetical protein